MGADLHICRRTERGKIMKIIVDAMGGDNAPQAPVMGAIQAGKE